MTRYSKYNVVYRLQKWMDSVPGQTFLNYAYSWGASIVILGTLFKLTHLPGANFFLFLGMGTEVFVFFISAFDRPFDKTTDGMDLPTHLEDEDIENSEETEAEVKVQPTTIVGGGGLGGGTIVIGGGASQGGGVVAQGGVAAVQGGAPVQGGASVAAATGAVAQSGEGASAAVAAFSAAPLTPDMTEATNAYVDELKKLTEVLEKVSEQSSRLTTDSEEMENLNRTLTGICKVYEMQLKSASSQIGTIDEINEQTKKLAKQIEELNRIYARMIEAMQAPMLAPKPGVVANGGE